MAVVLNTGHSVSQETSAATTLYAVQSPTLHRSMLHVLVPPPTKLQTPIPFFIKLSVVAFQINRGVTVNEAGRQK